MSPEVVESARPAEARPRGTSFAVLKYRNYRLWFFGQMVSLMGTWMQMMAQGWLVYQITGSRLALGLIGFAGSIAQVVLMLPAGLVADRVPKRTVLLITQSVMMTLAFVLATLVATGVVQAWHIAVLAFLLGVANAFDAPARQAIAVELVDDRQDLGRAIMLNSVMFNSGRVVGPAVAGVVLAAVGAAWCFALNGLSFVAVIVALALMRFAPRELVSRSGAMLAQIAVGLRYVRDSAGVRTVLMMLGVSSLFANAYSTLLPVFAQDVLHVGETGLGALSAASGLGALVGAFVLASLRDIKRKGPLLVASYMWVPAIAILYAFSRSYPVSLGLLVLAGFGGSVQPAMTNTVVQTLVPDALRGRVMAVYSLIFFSSMSLGSLQAGVVAQALGPTAGVALGATVALLFAATVAITVSAVRKL
jgi:MFS family permease